MANEKISIGESEDNWFSPHNPSFPYDKVYEPLQDFEIRLILLLADTSNAPLRCELITGLSIDPISSTELEYEALSYCAGDPRSTESILVNGYPFNVFASLHSALGYLRDLETDRLI